MDFIDQLKQYSSRVETLKNSLFTEEATKTALIMPFFAMLGYDVFNPNEFVPEFTADVGIKKGEKVDYAIMRDGSPIILIECKAITEKLEKHDSQLFRYFGATTAKFAILTNGQIYKFYTDLDNPNKMDDAPFLTVDVLSIREIQVPEIKKFSKSVFDVNSIFSTASDLKYANEFKTQFAKQLDCPTDELVKLFLSGCWSAQKTQSVVERFRPILKKALGEYISELMNDKIKAALGSTGGTVTEPRAIENVGGASSSGDDEVVERVPNIVTTEEELEAYFIIKNLLSDVADVHDITYKDTESYINVLYKANSRKWICRLKLTNSVKVLILPDGSKNGAKYKLNDIYDLKDYSSNFHAIVEKFITE